MSNYILVFNFNVIIFPNLDSGLANPISIRGPSWTIQRS